MNKNLMGMFALAVALAAPAARAQDVAGENHVGVMGDFMVKPDDRHNPKLDDGKGVELRYGYRSGKPWGYEVRAFHAVLKPSDPAVAKGHRSGLGVDAVYHLPTFAGLTLYAMGGVGLAYNDALPGRDWIAPLVNGGVGILTGKLFEVGGHPLRLRAEYRYSYEDYRDEYTGSTTYDRSNYVDRHVYAGFEIGLTRPPPPPEPVQVVEPPPPPPPPPPLDTDGDGVTDDLDACPGSPAGKPVDARGCTVLTLKGVTFELNSAKLQPQSLAVLDEAVATLTADFPSAHIEVAGHTDNTGDDARNQKLSLRRASSVRDYLVEHGVASERLSVAGYGAAQPVTGNDTDEGRAENRRVELRVQGEAAPAVTPHLPAPPPSPPAAESAVVQP